MFEPTEDADAPPLDPAMLRVQRRLRRLMLTAVLTLGVGLFAVLVAVVYKISTTRATSSPPTAILDKPAIGEFSRGMAGLSADAKLVGTALDGDRLALSYADGAATVVVVVDTRTMGIVGRFRIGE